MSVRPVVLRNDVRPASRLEVRSARWSLLLVALLALVFRLIAVWAIPLAGGAADPNCAPDESWHFWVAKDLAAGRAPTWPEHSWSIYSAFLPSQYVVQGATLSLARFGLEASWLYRFPVTEPLIRGYPLARLGSVLMGVLTVVALARAAAAWTASTPWMVTAGLVAALYPQLIFVSAYVNADIFTIAAGSLLILALSRWALAGEASAHLGVVGLAIGGVILGKVSGYFLLPPTAAWLVWSWATRRTELASLARAAALTMVVAAPFLIWNGIRNEGDPLGLGRYALFLSQHWHRSYPGPLPGSLLAFATILGTSAFGVFRNMDLALPSGLYQIALVLLTIGLVRSAWVLRRASSVAKRAAAWLVSAALLNLALVAYNCWRVDFQPQGRYVLLTACVLTITAAIGPAYADDSRRWRAWPAAYLAFMLAAAAYAEALMATHPCVA